MLHSKKQFTNAGHLQWLLIYDKLLTRGKVFQTIWLPNYLNIVTNEFDNSKNDQIHCFKSDVSISVGLANLKTARKS